MHQLTAGHRTRPSSVRKQSSGVSITRRSFWDPSDARTNSPTVPRPIFSNRRAIRSPTDERGNIFKKRPASSFRYSVASANYVHEGSSSHWRGPVLSEFVPLSRPTIPFIAFASRFVVYLSFERFAGRRRNSSDIVSPRPNENRREIRSYDELTDKNRRGGGEREDIVENTDGVARMFGTRFVGFTGRPSDEIDGEANAFRARIRNSLSGVPSCTLYGSNADYVFSFKFGRWSV